jgi:hypothetical protein
VSVTPKKEFLMTTLTPQSLIGGAARQPDSAPIPGATWYTAALPGDGLAYTFPVGALAGMIFLSADVLLDGNQLCVFLVILQEGADGPAFTFSQGFINQCQARIRLPLEAVNQGRWMYEREGAWLKPRCGGQRVDLAKVDRMSFVIERHPQGVNGPLGVRWCLTDFTATVEAPPRLENPLLPKGVLLDELGQSTLHEWPAKSRSADEVTARLQAQLAAAPAQRWPAEFSRWGGWKEKQLTATGWFRVEKSDDRWWLVDPDGYAFWSAGMDCVRVDTAANVGGMESALAWLPEADGPFQAARTERANWEDHTTMVNYLAANFIRAFGEGWYEKWAEIALAELRRTGFNTVANWSEWEIARAAGFPYVRPLNANYEEMLLVYRDFPDVFDPRFEQVCAEYASQLIETHDDPAFIGYFLMNEPTWGFSQESPAAGMLFNTDACYTRKALSQFLYETYDDDARLSQAWGMEVTFQAVAESRWHQPLTQAALIDLNAFSVVMVEKFFGGLSRACKHVDPHHLNLGIRYYTIPPAWALQGMRHFDVFSMNCYRLRLPADEMAQIAEMLNMPIMVGEWHFGALDVGLPASGIGHVPTQADRGRAFRFYTEDAAAKPWCVGVHYFILYDQSALGRFDGENYNIGFLDVCNRPYEELCLAARAAHEKLYPVAVGQVAPFSDSPEHLPMLFM